MSIKNIEKDVKKTIATGILSVVFSQTIGAEIANDIRRNDWIFSLKQKKKLSEIRTKKIKEDIKNVK